MTVLSARYETGLISQRLLVTSQSKDERNLWSPESLLDLVLLQQLQRFPISPHLSR